MDALYSNRRVVLILVAAGAIGYALQNGAEGPRSRINIGQAITSGALATSAPGYEGIVFTQAPAMRNGAVRGVKGALFPTRLGEGAHLAVLSKEGNVRTLTPDFESAADPAVSFDGKRILFAGKKSAKDTWNIFEVNVDGSGLRQITRDMGNCRSPIYQSALFYLNDPKPSYQITFVSDAARELNEVGSMLATNLYSIRMDGAGIRRLTYGISTSYDPLQMQDGRILFSHWQADRLQPGPDGRFDLFGIGLDGTDYAAFSGSQGKRVKQMACTTLKRKAVFVESETASWDGAGNLATLDLRRNFHSYRVVTTSSDGLFHSPSALPDGSILVSRRSAAGTDTHSIYRMDLQTGRRELLISDPAFENIQAVVLAPRPEPDGHSSVVEDDQDWSKLYCLSIRHTDLKPEGMLLEKAARIRVVEGVPVVELSLPPQNVPLSSGG
jgi:hypothetical protein